LAAQCDRPACAVAVARRKASSVERVESMLSNARAKKMGLNVKQRRSRAVPPALPLFPHPLSPWRPDHGDGFFCLTCRRHRCLQWRISGSTAVLRVAPPSMHPARSIKAARSKLECPAICSAGMPTIRASPRRQAAQSGMGRFHGIHICITSAGRIFSDAAAQLVPAPSRSAACAFSDAATRRATFCGWRACNSGCGPSILRVLMACGQRGDCRLGHLHNSLRKEALRRV